MKKSISLLLVVLILLLSGCSRIPDAYGGPKQTDTPQNESSVLLITPHFSDYDEYLKYIESVKWPYGFAEWSDLDFLGEWRQFNSNTHSGLAYTRYRYWFIDDSEIYLWISIDHTIDYDLYDQAPLAKISDDMTSMRQHTDTENHFKLSKIDRNGVQYHYIAEGQLHYIRWIQNGVEYVIGGDKWLYPYPEDVKDTFIARLLSLDDAEFKLALAEINPDPMTN